MDKFEKLGVIGRGAFGICYLCQAKNDRHKVVIKSVLIDCRTEHEENVIMRKCFFFFSALNYGISVLYSIYIALP